MPLRVGVRVAESLFVLLYLYDLIEPSEVVSIVLLCLVLLFIGGKVMQPDAGTLRWARRLAMAALLAYVGLGAAVCGPGTVDEWLGVTLRAGMAAAMVYSLGLIIVGLVQRAIANPFGRFLAWCQCKASERRTFKRQRRSELERVERERNESQLAEQRRLQGERDRKLQQRRSSQAERERAFRVSDACGEVTQFYESHAEELAEALPAALFRARMQTAFPEGISSAAAWQAAQGLISEMLSLLASASERRRDAEREERQKREAEAQSQQAGDVNRTAVSRLTAWYESEKAAIEASMPPGRQRDVVLLSLADRYDQLMKEALQEVQL